MLDFAQQVYIFLQRCVSDVPPLIDLSSITWLCATLQRKNAGGFRSWNYGKICPACCQRAKTPFVTHQNYLDRLLRSHCNFSTKTLRATLSVSYIFGPDLREICCYTLLRGLTIDSIVQNFGFFFPEALTRKSKTIAYMEHLL